MIALQASRHRVLVVDDDEAVRLRVRDLLEKPDECEILEAESGAAGLEIACAQQPDLILLDVMMPGMSGLEVCARLRENKHTRDIPIIILSAGDEQQSMPAALRAGAEDYLPKPIPAAELLAKVANIMRLDRFRSLNRKSERLKWLVENSCEALVIIDRTGRLLETNLQARHLFGLPETPGADALALIEANYTPDPFDAFEALRARGFLPGESFSICRPENALAAARWLEVGLFADATDRAGDLLLKFTDRSVMVQRDLETWTFQHMISHKIRTPLNGISSLIELMGKSPAIQANPDHADLMNIVLESSRRLEDSLISILRYHDALHSARPEGRLAGSSPQTWEQIIRSALAEAGLSPDQFQLRGAPPPATSHALAEALHLGLVEVIDNYLKFSDARATGIQAEFITTPGVPARLRISSAGPELPPDAIALLGRPYWQMENRFSGEVPGMGLGLATARICLRSLGADLRFSANHDPVGLTTEFILPAA